MRLVKQAGSDGIADHIVFLSNRGEWKAQVYRQPVQPVSTLPIPPFLLKSVLRFGKITPIALVQVPRRVVMIVHRVVGGGKQGLNNLLRTG